MSPALPDLFGYKYLASAASLGILVATEITGGPYIFLGYSLRAQRAQLSLTFFYYKYLASAASLRLLVAIEVTTFFMVIHCKRSEPSSLWPFWPQIPSERSEPGIF